MTNKNPKWNNAISRLKNTKVPDVWGCDFEIDKNLITNSEGYDRLRSKTMVYPLPQNDMVLTRSAHVLQVANVATAIAKQLGLNEMLVQAIAHGHDIGHSPFGHDGERALKYICQQYNLPTFWHEKNGVRMVDKFLTNINFNGENENINLTYAVRDGIISHCGEVDENCIRPRNEFIDLESIAKASQYQPYTWEGVVVKISDFSNQINNTSLTDLFIKDIVKNSTLQKGIGFSQEVAQVLDAIKKYNMKNLYVKDSLRSISKAEVQDILLTSFRYYDSLFSGVNTANNLKIKNNFYLNSFSKLLDKFS